jgi:phosphoserine phosphatase
MTKIRIVPKHLLDNLNRWDAPHVLAVSDEMEARDIPLDDAEGAADCSNDLKFLESVKQKVRILPCPTPSRYP